MTTQLTEPGRSNLSRREFVRSLATTGLAVGLGAGGWAAETKSGDMLYRTLGRTGERVSAIGLGGVVAAAAIHYLAIGPHKEEKEGSLGMPWAFTT